MSKQIIFIGGQSPLSEAGQHEYDYTEQDNSFSLHYSDSEVWSDHIRGKVACEIKEESEGLILKYGDIEIYLEDDVAEQFSILLAAMYKSKGRFYEIGKLEQL